MTIKSDIIARIRLLRTEEGGWRHPKTGPMLKCPLEFQGKMFDCAVFLDDVGPLAPGDEAKVPIDFLWPELIVPRLKVGDHFTLWDLGTKAEGVVEEIGTRFEGQ
jgi:hypothetical protein